MEITTASVTSSATPAPLKGSTAISSDFETFLKMLTVQMQNQDPLKPIEASDYAVQLATFSNVEQSVRTNQLLEAMQGQFGLLSLSQMASWIGKEALVTAPVHVDGTSVTLAPDFAPQTTRAVLVVRDQSDNVVSREDLPVGEETAIWTGTDIAGNPLPPGHYQLSVENYRDDAKLSDRPIAHYARIAEVRADISGPGLVLEGGVKVAAEAVSALRTPPPV